MARPTKNFRLWKKDKKIYYFKLPGGCWKSTGCTRKTDAENFANDRLVEWDPPISVPKGKRLRDFIEPYFVWDRCPRIAERIADGKRISKEHAKHQRAVIENYILTDQIADINMHKLTRGNVKDFKARLIQKYGQRRFINSVLRALKTIIHDGYDREILKRDCTAGIGLITYDKRESGVFNRKEISDLFPKVGYGPWMDLQDYTAFLVAATCGLRRGEILALQWGDIDFEENIFHVQHAWKSDTELGEPKWGQVRDVPLPLATAQKLKELRIDSIHVLPDALVFHNEDGSRKGTTWWKKRFDNAMKAAGIDYKNRNLTGHSFRHTLNTILRDQGYSDEKIRAALGWSNPQTQAGYTHWKPEHLRGQADIVDDIFS